MEMVYKQLNNQHFLNELETNADKQTMRKIGKLTNSKQTQRKKNGLHQ